ncbi:hypothetical protein B932_0835 [Gluconobacter oxydans H24]|nr:hypothetical protein B932_0835 [Gluconobacter oxydans H24]
MPMTAVLQKGDVKESAGPFPTNGPAAPQFEWGCSVMKST